MMCLSHLPFPTLQNPHQQIRKGKKEKEVRQPSSTNFDACKAICMFGRHCFLLKHYAALNIDVHRYRSYWLTQPRAAAHSSLRSSAENHPLLQHV